MKILESTTVQRQHTKDRNLHARWSKPRSARITKHDYLENYSLHTKIINQLDDNTINY